MSDAKVSSIVGQEVWAAVSVVFCVAVILVFFFILCCAYRRHRRVRDLTMFAAPVLDELGNHSTPWLVSNAKEKHEPDIKRTSGVWRGTRNSILVEYWKQGGLKHLSDNTKEQRERWFIVTTRKEQSNPRHLSVLFTFTGTFTVSSRLESSYVVSEWKILEIHASLC